MSQVSWCERYRKVWLRESVLTENFELLESLGALFTRPKVLRNHERVDRLRDEQIARTLDELFGRGVDPAELVQVAAAKGVAPEPHVLRVLTDTIKTERYRIGHRRPAAHKFARWLLEHLCRLSRREATGLLASVLDMGPGDRWWREEKLDAFLDHLPSSSVMW